MQDFECICNCVPTNYNSSLQDTFQIHFDVILYVEKEYYDGFWAYRGKLACTARKTNGELIVYMEIRAYREKLARTARKTNGELIVYMEIRAYREKRARTAQEISG